MKLETQLAQAGSRWDERTGAVSMPVYHASTFRHPALGRSTGFDYSRTSNPTRLVLEQTVAAAEGGDRAFAFASGLAGVDAVAHLFKPGDRLLASEDLYGGTYRLFEKVLRPFGLAVDYVDTSSAEAVARAWRPDVRGLFVESPSNPLLKIADLRALSALARQHGALFIVDNTFMTPVLQRPIELGADLVVYSATKYLGGHNDVLAGVVVAREPEWSDRLAFHQNAVGAVLGPQDAWLLLRGLKTLPLRVARQEANAGLVAEWLARHPRVTRVYYPGLQGNPDRGLQSAQARGFGSMISFEVDRPEAVPEILRRVKVFIFAESLGGVESLITFPVAQTHSDVEPERRARLGITDRLLRLSVGIEDAQDLIDDLDQALCTAPGG